MVYKWTEDIRWVGIDPQIAGETLEAIRRNNNGVLTASVVVEASRPETAPLHNCFEWDDKKAGAKYRESQARTVIRSIRVIEPTQESEPVRIRAIANKKKPVSRRVQKHISLVIESPHSVIRDSIEQLATLRSKLETLPGLRDVCAAIERIETNLKNKATCGICEYSNLDGRKMLSVNVACMEHYRGNEQSRHTAGLGQSLNGAA